MITKKPRYTYRSERDGCNDLWVIVDTKTDRAIACAIYWDCDPKWAERTRADIRLILDAMNAYKPATSRRD